MDGDGHLGLERGGAAHGHFIRGLVEYKFVIFVIHPSSVGDSSDVLPQHYFVPIYVGRPSSVVHRPPNMEDLVLEQVYHIRLQSELSASADAAATTAFRIRNVPNRKGEFLQPAGLPDVKWSCEHLYGVGRIEGRQVGRNEVLDIIIAPAALEACREGGREEQREGEAILSGLNPDIEFGKHKLLIIGIAIITIVVGNFVVVFSPIDLLLPMQLYVELTVWAVDLAVDVHDSFHSPSRVNHSLVEGNKDGNIGVFVLG